MHVNNLTETNMNYFVQFKKKKVDLYNQYKQLTRRFNMKSDVVNAQITGAGQDCYVAITMSNGKTELYKSNGQLVRK